VGLQVDLGQLFLEEIGFLQIEGLEDTVVFEMKDIEFYVSVGLLELMF
jgi:hypothetical protein